MTEKRKDIMGLLVICIVVAAIVIEGYLVYNEMRNQYDNFGDIVEKLREKANSMNRTKEYINGYLDALEDVENAYYENMTVDANITNA